MLKLRALLVNEDPMVSDILTVGPVRASLKHDFKLCEEGLLRPILGSSRTRMNVVVERCEELGIVWPLV